MALHSVGGILSATSSMIQKAPDAETIGLIGCIGMLVMEVGKAVLSSPTAHVAARALVALPKVITAGISIGPVVGVAVVGGACFSVYKMYNANSLSPQIKILKNIDDGLDHFIQENTALKAQGQQDLRKLDAIEEETQARIDKAERVIKDNKDYPWK